MSEVTATEAARSFATLLDSVEYSGERYTVIRHGRAVAQIDPVSRGRGSDLKRILEDSAIDSDWASELEELRNVGGLTSIASATRFQSSLTTAS